jgi:Asp-tRNA(Asn)/Glu-tRNA(Gln) amidotransferase A subunit family amidase
MSTPASTMSELTRRIGAKEVTSREVVEALLERIEAVNPDRPALSRG